MQTEGKISFDKSEIQVKRSMNFGKRGMLSSNFRFASP